MAGLSSLDYLTVERKQDMDKLIYSLLVILHDVVTQDTHGMVDPVNCKYYLIVVLSFITPALEHLGFSSLNVEL